MLPGDLHLFSFMRPQHRVMNPEPSVVLHGAVAVFFCLVAQAWALLILWAEIRVTRPAGPPLTGPNIHKEEE
jgi:hypothetical protein